MALGCHAEEAAAAGEAFLIATQVDDLWPAVLARCAQIFIRRRRRTRHTRCWTRYPFVDRCAFVRATLRRRAGTDSVNVRERQHAMMLSSGGVTKRLDRLETAHLIERHPDPSDRRGVLIRLSNTGLDLIDRAVVAVTEFDSSAVGNAIGSDKERLQLENGLRRMLTAHERP